MKNNSTPNPSYERATGRAVFCFIRALSDVKLQNGKWRFCKCDLIKLPRMPPQIKSLAFWGYEMSKEMKKHCSHTSKKYSLIREIIKRGAGSAKETSMQSQIMHTSQCCSSTAAFHSEEFNFTNPDLTSQRIMHLRFKEHIVAFRSLKRFSRQIKNPQSKKHEIILLSKRFSSSQQDLNNFWVKTDEMPSCDIGNLAKFFAD